MFSDEINYMVRIERQKDMVREAETRRAKQALIHQAEGAAAPTMRPGLAALPAALARLTTLVTQLVSLRY